MHATFYCAQESWPLHAGPRFGTQLGERLGFYSALFAQISNTIQQRTSASALTGIDHLSTRVIKI